MEERKPKFAHAHHPQRHRRLLRRLDGRRLRPHSGGVTLVSGTSRICPERFVTDLPGSHTVRTRRCMGPESLGTPRFLTPRRKSASPWPQAGEEDSMGTQGEAIQSAHNAHAAKSMLASLLDLDAHGNGPTILPPAVRFGGGPQGAATRGVRGPRRRRVKVVMSPEASPLPRLSKSEWQQSWSSLSRQDCRGWCLPTTRRRCHQ